ncbi:MAG: phosphatase PAP2 family protein [Tepidisphaeraceae bacterium]
MSRLKSFFRLPHWLARHGWAPITAALLFVAGVWLFYGIADEVREGDTQRFDERVVRALRRPDNLSQPIGPKWLVEVGRDVTALGGMAVLTLVTMGVCGYLAVARRWRTMVFVILATTGGLLLSLWLKGLFDRERPSVVPHLDEVFTSSFPSGHAMLSSIVYLTHGTLLMRVVKPWRLRLYILSIALLLPLLIGLSRVYLGVHYPTDVLAGWTAGLAWGLGCWSVTQFLQHRGNLEPEPPDTDEGDDADSNDE